MADTVQYQIEVADAAAHRYRVRLCIAKPEAVTVLSLPVWIPGSYMVREFSRHLSGFEARQGRKACAVQALDKASWRVECTGQAMLVLTYEVYAFDTSVRTAFLDDQRGFFNPTSVCLRVHGRERRPHEITLARLPKDWEVATAMAGVGRWRYRSADYDELVDHPFELGRFWRGGFLAGGVSHEFVVAGAWPGFDGERLLADTRRICVEQIAFWHGRRKPPFARYVFLLNAVEDGYGGLEHRASTALIAKRSDLPRLDQAGPSEGYVTLLGLISHEYFHTWNVKRLKPVEFHQYDYTRENYTQLLWFFEGFTSYYDDLFLLRSGLIDAPRYLKLLSRTLHSVEATPGQAVQSVAEASFDAWIKYYRPDENSPNASVSYYTKGALIALLLDLRLRQADQGSLDDLMRRLWQRCVEPGLSEDDVFEEVASLGGQALRDELVSWVHGRQGLPLEARLVAMGLRSQSEPVDLGARLGLRLTESAMSGSHVKSVLAGSAAARAGVCAGDELLAVNGWRIRRLDDAAQWLGACEEAFELLVCRGQRVRSLRVRPVPGARAQAQVWHVDDRATDKAQALRRHWLRA